MDQDVVLVLLEECENAGCCHGYYRHTQISLNLNQAHGRLSNFWLNQFLEQTSGDFLLVALD